MRAVLLAGAAALCLSGCSGVEEDFSIPDKPYPNLADVPGAPRLELAPGQVQRDFDKLEADRTAAIEADRRLRGGEALAAAGVGAPAADGRPARPAPDTSARPAPAKAPAAARPSAPAGRYAHADRLGVVAPPAPDGSWAPADRLTLVAAADAARSRPGRLRVVPVAGAGGTGRGALAVAEALIGLGVPANRVVPPATGRAASVEIYLDY